MSTHWQELDRIFAEARDLPAAQQAEFLARACGTNAALRAEAESLLSASQHSGEFLLRPAIEGLAHAFAGDGLNLQPGRRIGAYTILRPLGAGGAGEVWRAKDERLDRDVAIKVLLPHVTLDAEKLRRFAEEARAAGTLNHPNIVTVHDVGEHDGIPYLVSECLDGRNLRARMKSGALPIAEAVAIANGISQGLAAAHERGIVHRDLKPENIFVKDDGGIKLLDFGLAKLELSASSANGHDGNATPSLVAGTAAYMAPEQARGEAPDSRSDLFALGVMLYEMLAGQHPFRGASVFDTLHAILTKEPPDILGLNPQIPPPLARVVTRLLQKTPAGRFQSARDFAWSLAQAMEAAAPAPAKKKRAAWWIRIGAPLAFAASLGTGWWVARQAPVSAPDGPLTRFMWEMPPNAALDSPPAVSPDGRHIAFAARDAGAARLYVRDLGDLAARPLAGTAGASLPFWSPDGQSLGFFAAGKMQVLKFPDGAPATLAEAPQGRGAAWTSTGTIVFAPDLVSSGLLRIAAGGGTVEPATLIDRTRRETSHWYPVAIPGTAHFLFYVRSEEATRRGIYLGRIDQPAEYAGTRLFFADSGATLLPRGPGVADLVYLAEGRVESRRFDLKTLEAADRARTVDWMRAEPTLKNPLLVSASPDVLAFSESMVPAGNRMISLTLDGKDERAWPSTEAHNWPRVSPDGRMIARLHVDETWSQPEVWIEDLQRGTVYPALKTLDADMSPVWSPDGRQLAFVTGHLPRRKGPLALNLVAADGTGIKQSLKCPGDYCEPTDWSSDGRSLLVTSLEGGDENVWLVPTDPSMQATPLLTEDYAEKDARFSPNGHWIAYVSNEAGHPEVLVHSVQGPARRMTVSGEGGTQPVWKRDGTELYFVDLSGYLRSVAVHWSQAGEPTFGLPRRSALPQVGFGHWGTQYDISPDGKRIYFMEPSRDSPPREIQVAINWRSMLR